MTNLNLIESLILKLQEPGELSVQDQADLQTLLSTSEGRQQWVKELSFQADLTDVLKTEKELHQVQEKVASKVISISEVPVNKARVTEMSPSLRYAGWIALAACLMMAVFMSYYINGIPSKSNHTVLGKVLALQGEVHLNRGPLNVELIPDMNFKEGDRLLSSNNGVVVFEYEDGSKVSLAPNSRLVFATQKQKKQEGWSIGLDRGRLDAEIQPQKEKMRFKTPKVGVEVLGTQFSLESQESLQQVLLYEGKLSVVHLENKSKHHLLMAGQGLVAQGNSSDLNSRLIPSTTSVEGKILSLNIEKKLLSIETASLDTLTLRLPTSDLKNNHNLNEELQTFNDVKLGQAYRFVIQGLACPKILNYEPSMSKKTIHEE